MAMIEKLLIGDCIRELKKIEEGSVDLIYLDPPFFTQKEHSLTPRDNSKEYNFNDVWASLDEYLNFIEHTILEGKRILKDSGSIFVHCDRTASHHIRVILDKVFGRDRFQSEIIWSYKRWSNSKKGLLNAHQNIYFYSKTPEYKFNVIYTDYSPTTNVDQILQARVRDNNGRSAYMRDDKGNVVLGKEKRGVPLSDVWSIPFLNPKAKERVGYPTQKPVLLLKRIIQIASEEGDVVLDPFCGSGTTCVAAKLLNRGFIGIDRSGEAIALARKRLEDMVISDSPKLRNGEGSYIEKTKYESAILESINAVPVQRNKGIDGFLKDYYNEKPVPVKIQANDETLEEAKEKLERATASTNSDLKILIKTNENRQNPLFDISHRGDSDILVIDSYDLIIDTWKKKNLNMKSADYRTPQDHVIAV